MDGGEENSEKSNNEPEAVVASDEIVREESEPSYEKGISDEEEVKSEEKVDFKNIYELAIEERRQLEEENLKLQYNLAFYFMERQFETLSSNTEDQYSDLLSEIEAVLAESEHFKGESEKNFSEIMKKIDDEEREAANQSLQFNDVLQNVALKSRFATTGEERIPQDKVNFYLIRLDAENKLKREACWEYTKERIALECAESTKRTIAKIKCPMSMYDYELMVSETHVLNSKIEQKKKEVKNLDRSCWDVLNVMTHLKNKLFFVRKRKQELRSNIKELGEEVDKMTNELLTMKEEHEVTTKTEQLKMKEKFFMLENESMLQDYEKRKEKVEELKKEVKYLKKRYSEAVMRIEQNKTL